MMLRQFIFSAFLLVVAWNGHSQEPTTVTNLQKTNQTNTLQPPDDKQAGITPPQRTGQLTASQLPDDRPSIITIEQKEVSLKEIIKQFESQSPYSFIYNETIDLDQKKSVVIRQQPHEVALKLVFEQTGIVWKIKNNHITLSNKKNEPTAQKITISGYITDVESSEVLIGAHVYDFVNKTGTATNEFGFFSITLPAGQAELRFSYAGYASEIQKIDLTKDKTIHIRLKTNMQQLEEVVVTSRESSESGIGATHMGSFHMPLHLLKSTPVLLGEADVLKALQTLPGVQAGTQGSAGVYVRGGGPDENLILLDGIPIYNVDHLLGFFSVFTPEAVKKVTLFKSSFPARFGGRLSSVIDVRTNDGDMHNYHGTASIGLLSSKLQFEGPIMKDRTSFHISGRRSYLDLMAKPFFKEDDITLFFYDLNAKINHKFNDKSRLFLSFYNGRDKFGSDFRDSEEGFIDREKQYLAWGNTLISARWNYTFSPKLFSNTTIAHTNYRFNIEAETYESIKKENSEYQRNSNYTSGIKDLAYKMDFDYFPSPRHHIKFGLGYLYHQFKPEVETLRIKENEDDIKTDTTYSRMSDIQISANEASVYAEDDIQLTPRLHVNAGLHFSLFNVQNTTYTSLQPRLTARYQLSDDISMKASYTKMNQYIHLLSSYNIAMPSDLWVPTTNRIKPMRAHQYSLGAYYTGIKGWEFSAETYYKDMRNILEYKDGATFLGSSYNWEDKVEMGRGRSYGIELMAQKTTGKTTGWIAYTLAKSERKFSRNGINRGEWFPYKYDRRHHINLTVNHKISDRIDISATWEFFTGGVFTTAQEVTSVINPQYAPYIYGGYYKSFDEYSYGPGSPSSTTPGTSTGKANHVQNRNNYRLPVSHCLNLGINFRKQKKHGERIWSFGIYNLYNAMNPHFVYRTISYEKSPDKNPNYGKPVLKKMTLFPIIPSFTYTFKF